MSEEELRVSRKAGRKAKDLTPACMDDLVNQVFDKSKQLSMSVKEQRKLVQEYLNAKIEDSDESDGEHDNDSDYGSYSDSGDDNFSDYEEETYSDSDEETEESSDALESGSSEDEEASPEVHGKKEQEGSKNLDGKVSKDKPKSYQPESSDGPPKSPSQPGSGIQRRMTMAGGLVASPIRKGSQNQKTLKTEETKSLPISLNKVKVLPSLRKEEPIMKASTNFLVKPKAFSFFKGINKPIIKLPDPRI
ncbi:clumping factor B [Drosophila subpulchrella]|uniref:clumping factor B n=1 Tax=Drosophila subpulchrella TaxID=1486046 RepID=UPI0018A14150|nr:clumping factor B [Drosophila subpulchrella]